jgi:hypothetical protein
MYNLPEVSESTQRLERLVRKEKDARIQRRFQMLLLLKTGGRKSERAVVESGKKEGRGVLERCRSAHEVRSAVGIIPHCSRRRADAVVAGLVSTALSSYVSRPAAAECPRYASAAEPMVEWCVLPRVCPLQLMSMDSDESDDRSPRPVWRY